MGLFSSFGNAFGTGRPTRADLCGLVGACEEVVVGPIQPQRRRPLQREFSISSCMRRTTGSNSDARIPDVKLAHGASIWRGMTFPDAPRSTGDAGFHLTKRDDLSARHRHLVNLPSPEGVKQVSPPAARQAATEGMEGHRRPAQMRLDRLQA